VVITIISMLMALLLPAVQSARESGRRATCMNNQKQLGLAMQQYEGKFRKFPGWKNTLTRDDDSTIAVSWVLPILPNLERSDIYKNWRNPSISYSITEARLAVFLRLLICPSDPPESTLANSTPLAYSVNCGKGDSNAYNGVFFDQTVSSPATMSLDYLSQHDGSSMTLLLSENINTSGDHKWAYANSEITNADNKLRRIGFRWDKGKIDYNITADLPRPSSYHAGGVIATFCDGHVIFLREEISNEVLMHLCTPDSKLAQPSVTSILSDADL